MSMTACPRSAGSARSPAPPHPPPLTENLQLNPKVESPAIRQCVIGRTYLTAPDAEAPLLLNPPDLWPRLSAVLDAFRYLSPCARHPALSGRLSGMPDPWACPCVLHRPPKLQSLRKHRQDRFHLTPSPRPTGIRPLPRMFQQIATASWWSPHRSRWPWSPWRKRNSRSTLRLEDLASRGSLELGMTDSTRWWAGWCPWQRRGRAFRSSGAESRRALWAPLAAWRKWKPHRISPLLEHSESLSPLPGPWTTAGITYPPDGHWLSGCWASQGLEGAGKERCSNWRGMTASTLPAARKPLARALAMLPPPRKPIFPIPDMLFFFFFKSLSTNGVVHFALVEQQLPVGFSADQKQTASADKESTPEQSPQLPAIGAYQGVLPQLGP